MTELVMMPPYVAPEHKDLMDKTEEILREYEGSLMLAIKKGLGDFPHPYDLMMAQKAFYNNEVRKELVRHLVFVTSICEMPRFMLKSANGSVCGPERGDTP